MKLVRTPEDRTDTPIENRYLQLLLQAAEDPGLGDFAFGVRVGPRAFHASRLCTLARKNGAF